ncbi:hypothetical protein N8I74_12945 [Chitiniphilus purpureus]|uniref:Lipoprotein n=1 Tax=Chitiniphilus purpureus TaxID=2981137 RepID=A0ABY6DIQ2_9NEIS|nr:hypothetical protein [Chitiniphilus sp. CD1]UXY14221.1 hypothetical protein N8I74_12945 [Chitiniphilus sp. CD1]
MRLSAPICLSLVLSLLAGCDQINNALNQQTENGQAIGAGCRQSGRALEDCYQRNPRVSKADIFAGWKQMNEYMQAKKLDIIPPPPDPTPAPRHAAPAASAAASAPASESSNH